MNQDVAEETTERIENRFGAASVWILNPGTEGNLPSDATGAGYLYMWTQILEGRNGLGENFNFFFRRSVRLCPVLRADWPGDMDKIVVYSDRRLAVDARLEGRLNPRELSQLLCVAGASVNAWIAVVRGRASARAVEMKTRQRQRTFGSQASIVTQGECLYGDGNPLSHWDARSNNCGHGFFRRPARNDPPSDVGMKLPARRVFSSVPNAVKRMRYPVALRRNGLKCLRSYPRRNKSALESLIWSD